MPRSTFEGGTLVNVETAGGEVNISDGDVAGVIQAYAGSEVNISGGDVAGEIEAYSGSEVNISGGTVGLNDRSDFLLGLSAFSGSVVNISGGIVQDGFTIGSEVNISGGTLGPNFDGFFVSEVNFFGNQFLLNGQLLDGLVAGELFTITEPITTLSGVLADGSSFNFSRLTSSGNSDVFSMSTTVTLTIGPAALFGDFDGDGNVGLDDLDRYNQNIGAVATGDLADLDLDGDGVVGANDFQTHYQTTGDDFQRTSWNR